MGPTMQKIETAEDKIHSLVPLVNFKKILGIDGREDFLSHFCLVTATYTIELFLLPFLYQLANGRKKRGLSGWTLIHWG